ncbi:MULTISPECIES: DUF2808 domain-containing protein [unclassified Tolypothrix]|uniref:DUF2808 domain-containing protein n=1 Tax=unclassified Tolypothrix TaxID=2649714 RepID=UPI0005EAB6BC|nr:MULTISPECIES: DUF2808 domain-containing protein [unclassified Tolypothrix]BAY90647.1 hypothetical protein NIES3275_26640 [Microchaete diplosiphon NIES-3275]EKF01485.1 hypothetical protein FDUTEX481_07932 [Tolypothrix sp. PCC 7601]MBE9082641.1 DUF2808 domain-containing protein [Tolypothrix sp. LEGE 11397]UYD24798.1 DUF2808 domain-containing protein [Tolypothrix sp. PCC 7712]UYD32971.1 DUF2808 domain-containing protein [Tolypothrix sp. PCC 7601]
MKNISRLSKAVLALSFGLCLLPISKTYAANTDVTVPLSARTTYNQTNVSTATYYFTVAVPASATKPLQQVTLTQIQGGENIEFDAQQSSAFVGTSDRAGENLPVAIASNPNQDNTVTIQFAQPLPPGQTVTIALKPYRNPAYEGFYLFNVKAAPVDQSTEGQSLGVAGLQFYQNDF